jgi:phospholipase/carboxylesterase
MTAAIDLGFVHRFVAGQAGAPALLLLHGTGGDESDLLPLGEQLAPGAALLSPRGQVLEHGMPRFFRRLAEGVFDQEDLARRTDDLARFIRRAREAYALGDTPLVAVGYSNGANIAASLLLRGVGVLAGAVLLRPMVPFEPASPAALEGVPTLLLAGRLDPIAGETPARLAELLREAGSDVELVWQPAAHGLIHADVDIAMRWMQARFSDSEFLR